MVEEYFCDNFLNESMLIELSITEHSIVSKLLGVKENG